MLRTATKILFTVE